jgi:hypothetical protein
LKRAPTSICPALALDQYTPQVYAWARDPARRDLEAGGKAASQGSEAHRRQFDYLVAAIELDGLEEVRKVPGYHDDCSRAFGSGSGRFG